MGVGKNGRVSRQKPKRKNLAHLTFAKKTFKYSVDWQDKRTHVVKINSYCGDLMIWGYVVASGRGQLVH